MGATNKYGIKKAMILVVIILSHHSVSGQAKDDDHVIRYPAEELLVHLTQTCLFPGEILGFRIYCTNPLFPDLEFSKIAFVEIVSERNASVMRKKILLEHGTGGGEFQLPDDLVSGIYTVLAYTNWLKNFGEETFYRQRILIIQPEGTAPPGGDTSGYLIAYPPGGETGGNQHTGIGMTTDKNIYTTREKVTLNIRLLQSDRQGSGGNFSVSVHRTEPVLEMTRSERQRRHVDIGDDEIVYLPDYGGIRLTGTLEDAFGVLSEARIILSLPGKGTSISSTLTDDKGRFHFLLPPRSGELDIVLTLPVDNARLNLEEEFWNGFKSPMIQPGFHMDEGTTAYLERKYVYLQLQERFHHEVFTHGGLSDGDGEDHERFYHHTARIINTDDYVLLDSLPEYFYELVPNVRFISSRGRHDIQVVDRISSVYFKEEPGVFVDGVFYTDYNQIAAIPVRELAEIRVLPEVYYYHDFCFGGIIDLHTKNSDFTAVRLLPNMIRLVIPLASEPEFKYLVVNHSPPRSADRLPDFRYLICWEPDVQIGPSGEHTLSFYTGDVTGHFTVKLSGLSNEGQVVCSETMITVVAAPEKDH
jgi:hypothetical protein